MSTRAPLLSKGSSRIPLTISFEDDYVELRVEHAVLTQALSEEFHFELRVKAPREFRLSSLIGKRSQVSFDDEIDLPSLFGVCTAVRHLSDDYEATFWNLTLEPRTAFLKLRRDHRIFRDLDASGIANALVQPLAAKVGAVRTGDLQGLPVHEYRVQYGEANLDALKRLLAEDGVSFLYDFRNECDLLLTTNTTTLEVGKRRLPFLAGASLAAGGGPVVTRVSPAARERVQRVQLRDDWMERPDFDAIGVFGVQLEGEELEHYAFDVGVENSQEELDRQAQLRLIELAGPARAVEVETNAFHTPGMALTIENSPVPEASVELLVVAVTSEWSASAGEARTWHRLWCIDREQQWVPPRMPKPRISGVQRATVVGEGEIDTDDYGRVLCVFDWDRGKTSSRRIEVSQAWAGMGYGHFTQPRTGDAVLVAYLDGDPDEPIIVGRVHNGKNRAPLSLPSAKDTSVWRSKSTPASDGYNELGMRDTSGEELLWLRAELDYQSVVQRDSRMDHGRDYSMAVGRHASIKVDGLTNIVCQAPATWRGVDLEVDASNQFKLSCDVRVETVGGSYRLSVGSLYRVQVAGDERHLVDAQFKVNAGTLELTAGGGLIQMANGTIHISIGGSSVTLTDGALVLASNGSTLTMNAGSITASSPFIHLNPA